MFWTSMPLISQSKSSSMFWSTLRGFCPWKINISGILRYPHFQKVCVSWFWIFFLKWLPRPNHCAHDVRSEILCRTPVSILRDLSPWPQTHAKTPKIVPLPECQPELSGYVHFTFFSHYFHIIFTFFWNMWFLYARYQMDVPNPAARLEGRESA